MLAYFMRQDPQENLPPQVMRFRQRLEIEQGVAICMSVGDLAKRVKKDLQCLLDQLGRKGREGEKVPGQVSVFVWFSHTDEEWKNQVLLHLAIPAVDGRVSCWDDRRMAREPTGRKT